MPLRIDIRADDEERRRSLREDVRAGLGAAPKELPPKWFYDERGVALFDAITRLPEYYLTRCEREILARRAAAVARLSRAETLVELGSGASDKTRILLDALTAAGGLRLFAPFDVCQPALRAASEALLRVYPGLDVRPVVGDFSRHLRSLPREGRRLVAFLGSTVGNLRPAERARFFRDVRRETEVGDTFLLGVDLVKDPRRLLAAYDDAQGLTAAFNRNLLRVLDRELGADFVEERFAHVAAYDQENEWIEMRLRSGADQVARVRDLGIEATFAAGEEMRTEISAKFRRSRLEAELGEAGFELAGWWTDRGGDFASTLWSPA